MALVGMDTDLANMHLGRLQSQGIQAIETIISQLDGLLNEIVDNWKGNDATHFHGDWQSIHRPNLNTITAHLTDFHTAFNQNIQDQITTSA